MKRGRGRGRALSEEADEDVLKMARTDTQTQPRPTTSTNVESARSLESIYVTRPPALDSKKGTSGRPVTIQTNFFRLLKSPTWTLYQYRVDFTPTVDHIGLRKALIAQQRSEFGGGGYLFDGTLLYLTKKLETANDVIVFQSESRENVQYDVQLKFTSEVSMKTSTSVQILNLILRKALQGLQLQLVGRNYYDAAAKINIRGEFNIELWPGYITSIRQHETELLICSEVAHKVMRTDTIHDNLQRIVREQRDYKLAFSGWILGQTVLTAYNNKTYRVDDVNYEKTPESTFDTKNGPISFVDYYKTHYNIIIRDMKQPLLVSKAKGRDIRGGSHEIILLIPELCRSTGLTEQMRTNFRFMRSMDEYNRMRPSTRIEKLINFNRRLKSCEKSAEFLNEWQLKLEDRMVEVAGRVLNDQKILWGNSEQTYRDADWTNDLRNRAIYQPARLQRWYIVVDARSRREALSFIDVLMDAAKGLRFHIDRPREKIISDDRLNAYIEALEQCAADNPQMIVCILPNNNSDRYGAIKKKCCIHRAIPTQVIVKRTITPKGGNARGLLSIATKIAIQMNCKLGGAAWSTPIPIPLMTIGIDVSVDSKDKHRSYGALVASIGQKPKEKYFSAVSTHSSGDGLCAELKVNVIKALRAYQELNRALPPRIVIYRSGVSDGNLKYVNETEVNVLADQFKEIYDSDGSGTKCRMSFIIVNTRINARFFANGNNPQPGTVIDDVVTLPECYDFYLIPQSVRQGTVSATNFKVIYDEMELRPDYMQQLTYKLCHLYYNWSGTVRTPAVCKYASKLAFLVAEYLHDAPNASLEKELYFL